MADIYCIKESENGSYSSDCIHNKCGVRVAKDIVFGLSGNKNRLYDTCLHDIYRDKDDKITLLWDGELYNKNELKKELFINASSPCSCTDTEMVAMMYKMYKTGSFIKLDGVFSGIIYDNAERLIIAFRSRFGGRELNYAKIGNSLIISTDINIILDHPGFKRDINRECIYEYLIFRLIAGEETMMKNVFKILPAHYLTIDSDGKYIQKRYWDIYNNRLRKIIDNEKRCVQAIEEALSEAIQRNTANSPEIGIELSGGLDSSLVVALARRSSSKGIRTYSAGFDDNDYPDLKYARLMSKKCGTEHHEYVIRNKEYTKEFVNAISSFGQPLKHPNTVGQYLLYKYMIEQAEEKVLSGTGSDTLFGGLDIIAKKKYFLIKDLIPLHNLGALPRLIKYEKLNLLDHVLRTSKEELIINSRAFNEPEESGYLMRDKDFKAEFIRRREYLDELNTESDYLNKDFYYGFKPTMFCDEEFTLSRKLGVQISPPYLSNKVVDLATSIPMKLKTKNWEKKYLIKQIAKKMLPQEILSRQKMGLPVPLAGWFRDTNGLGSLLSILTDETTKKRGIFDLSSLQKMIDEHRGNIADWSGLLWVALCLEIWCRIFIDRKKI